MRWLRNNGQKGAAIVLTAFLLPLLIALTGLTVDFGNAYVHHAQLQNATDAAALAGANAYYRNQESIEKHPKADEEATRYISGDKNNLSKASIAMLSSEPTYQAKTKDDVTYYHVKATQDVPMSFLRYFGKTTMTIHSESTAAISSDAASGDDKQLFIFRKALHIDNSIKNPDNFNIPGQILTTFDGAVSYTEAKDSDIHYSSQTDKLRYLFTEQARKDNLSINQAIEQNDSSNEKKHYTSQISKTEYDFDALWNSVSSHLFDNLVTNQKPTSSDFDNREYVTFDTGKTNNIDLTIDHPIAGDKDTPVYMLIKTADWQWGGLSILNVDLKADTRRPFIICLDPADATGNSNSSQIHVNLNGHTFRGVIYAKNMSDEGVLIHDKNSIFQGSIIANVINLKDGDGTYRYEYFKGISPDEKSGGSSSGKHSNSATPKITLASPADISWD